MARLGRRRLRDYPSPRVLFVDTHAPADPMWWIIGTQRSGTTWLAELVDPEQRRRVIFEPFHTVHSDIARRLGLVWGEYLPPGTEHPQLADALDRIAEGRVRDAWASRHNRRRFYTSRLVKDVATTNLVPWIARRRPDDRVALVVRNPFAVVWSLLDVPWTAGRNDTRAMVTHAPLLGAIGPVPDLDGWIHRADDDAFVNRMLKWCLENTVPLRAADRGGFQVVRYEDLVTDPAGATARFGAALVGDPTRPSRTDFRSRARTMRDSPERLVTEWRVHLSPAQVRVGLEMLEAFGLTAIYTDDPWPRRAVDSP